MRYIQNYNDYQKIDEGLKNWVATFLLLANMGFRKSDVTIEQANRKISKKET